jgi:hypothetical protein
MGEGAAYIVVLVLREQVEEFGEEDDELIGHLVELGDVAVSVDEAEASTDG